MLFCALSVAAQTPDGAAIYQQQCARCHDDPKEKRAPKPAAMKQMAPEYILRTLESGVMMTQGWQLKPAERRIVSEFLSGKPLNQTAPARSKRKKRAKASSSKSLTADRRGKTSTLAFHRAHGEPGNKAIEEQVVQESDRQ